MATEPRPMDPERLASIREGVEWRRERPQPGDDDRDAIIAELLADRDYQAKRADTAEANYRFMVERAADEKLDGYRELGARAADAERQRDDARAEVLRLRSRVRVEASDVELAGVTQARVEAWLSSGGSWARIDTPDSRTSAWAWRGDGSTVIIGCDTPEYLADRIQWIAKYEHRSSLDILDEMARMEVEP